MNPSIRFASILTLGVAFTGCEKSEVRESNSSLPAAPQISVPVKVAPDGAIATRVKKGVGEILNKSPDSIRDSDRFVQNLGADSLDIVEIVMVTEEAFGIEIKDEDAVRIVTVGQLVEYVEARLKEVPLKSVR
ncbi:MAG: acyl carrier protein [Luteolibacter sp.]